MAKLTQLEIDIIVQADKAISEMNKLKGKVKQTGDESGKAGKAAGGMGKGFAGAAVGIGIAVAAVTKMIAVTKEFIDLAQKQELAEVKLTNALRKRSETAEEDLKMLKKQATALQDLTGIGDEQTIQAQAMLATFNLNAEAIANLTPSVLDMAAATQQATGGTADLQAVAMQLGKAITDSPATLKRYGIAMTDVEEAALGAAEGQEKAALLAEIVQNNFGGTAEAIGDTSVGAYQKLDGMIGDVKENLGFLIIEGLKPLIVFVTKVVRKLREFTDRGTESAGMLGTLIDGLKVIIEVAIAFLEIGGEIIAVLMELVGASEGAASGFDLLKKAIKLVRLGILGMRAMARGAIAALREMKTVTIEFWDAITSLDFASLGEILAGGAKRMKDAYSKGFESVVDDYNKTQKELAESGSLVPTPGGGGDRGKGKGAKEVDPDIELQKNLKFLFDRKKQNLEFLAKEEEEATRIKLEKQKERDALLAEQHQEFLDHQSDEEFKQILADNAAAEDLAIQRENAKREAAATTFAMAKALFGDNFDMQKAFAASEAGMNVFQAATKALTAGPIIGPILAGIIAGIGAVQVNKILAQKKPGLASGGFTGDVPITQEAGTVHGQEFVNDAPTTRRHREGLEKMNAGATPAEAFGLTTPGAPPSQQPSNTSVSITGRLVAKGTDMEVVLAEVVRQGRRGSF